MSGVRCWRALPFQPSAFPWWPRRCPIAAGALLRWRGYELLFLCAAVIAAAGFVTMLLARHEDSLASRKRGLERFDDGED